MEKEIKKIVDFINKNWDKFPKSYLNKEEFVIFATGDFSGEYGYGSSDLEGYGVNKNGKLVWVYASGCSCNCGTDAEEKDIKKFLLEQIPDDVSIDLKKRIVEFNENIDNFIKNTIECSYDDF